MHKANQKWKVLINLMFLMQSKPFRGYFAARIKCQTFDVYQKNVSYPISLILYAKQTLKGKGANRDKRKRKGDKVWILRKA